MRSCSMLSFPTTPGSRQDDVVDWNFTGERRCFTFEASCAGVVKCLCLCNSNTILLGPFPKQIALMQGFAKVRTRASPPPRLTAIYQRFFICFPYCHHHTLVLLVPALFPIRRRGQQYTNTRKSTAHLPWYAIRPVQPSRGAHLSLSGKGSHVYTRETVVGIASLLRGRRLRPANRPYANRNTRPRPEQAGEAVNTVRLHRTDHSAIPLAFTSHPGRLLVCACRSINIV